MMNKFRVQLNDQSGSSLIELMMAVLILTIGILGLAPLMALSVRGSSFGENTTAVVAAAHKMIEQKIGATGFPTIPYVETQSLDNGKYAVKTTVTDKTVDASVPAHVYRVFVEVNWTDDSKVNRKMTFTTYTTKN